MPLGSVSLHYSRQKLVKGFFIQDKADCFSNLLLSFSLPSDLQFVVGLSLLLYYHVPLDLRL